MTVKSSVIIMEIPLKLTNNTKIYYFLFFENRLYFRSPTQYLLAWE